MENLLFALLMLFYVTILAYPVFGFIQVTDAFYMYFQKGREADYYRALRKYGLMVCGFALGAFVLFETPLGASIDDTISGFAFIYLLVIPIPIALYKRSISKTEYFEPIEKLIF